MRAILVGLVGAALFLPASAASQGRIIPCMDCPRPVPGASVERTRSDVRVELRDRVLHYEVEERFVNRGGLIGEADYLFPLPTGAAFQDLKLSIDGEMVAGEVLDANEARRIYEEIVRRQRDPALVEWMGQGLLRTRIFPIQPGEERRIIVRFQSVARREGSALRVDYDRGTPHAAPVPRPMMREDGRRIDERRGSGESRFTTSFTLTYDADASLGRPYSPTHSLEVDQSRGRITVDARGGANDVTVLLPVRRAGQASIGVLTHAPSRDDGFVLLTITPPAIRGSAATPRDVTFVIDVSGSMQGGKLAQAKAAGRQLLATLDEGDRFRIIDFSSGVEDFRDGFVAATRDNVRAGERYLESLDATGGTNIAGALEAALDIDTPPNRLPLVLFLTDGAPTVGTRDPEAIAELASRLRGRARLFTFGLGADVNAALLEQLALGGNGTAHFVRPEEDVERVVALVASRLTHPVATNLRVRAEGVRLERMHPSLPLDLFAGEDLVLLARYEGTGDARITVEGDGPDGRVRWSTVATFPDRERGNAFVPRLWATQRVGWLSAERRRAGGNAELDAEIKELGERYGIPTEFTSYFVREPGMMADGVRREQGRVAGGNTAAAPAAIGRGQVELQAVVVTGASEFDAAKTSAEQRQARNLSAADSIATARAEALGETEGAVRRVDSRTFVLRNGTWTDAAFRTGTRTISVKPYSRAYFEVLELVPALRSALALGDRVTVAGRGVALAVTPDGAEQLTASDRSLLRSGW